MLTYMVDIVVGDDNQSEYKAPRRRNMAVIALSTHTRLPTMPASTARVCDKESDRKFMAGLMDGNH